MTVPDRKITVLAGDLEYLLAHVADEIHGTPDSEHWQLPLLRQAIERLWLVLEKGAMAPVYPNIVREADRIAVQLRTALKAAEDIREAASSDQENPADIVIEFNWPLLDMCVRNAMHMLPALGSAYTEAGVGHREEPISEERKIRVVVLDDNGVQQGGKMWVTTSEESELSDLLPIGWTHKRA